jgi:hypothetical protein
MTPLKGSWEYAAYPHSTPHLDDDVKNFVSRASKPHRNDTACLYKLIGHMRPVVVAGIDMVHGGRYRLPQNSNGLVNVTWRSPDARTCQLQAP